MTDICKLYEQHGEHGRACDKDTCIFWRAVGHLGIGEAESGCAIQHFEMLGGDSKVLEWLLSVKQRVDEQLDSDS